MVEFNVYSPKECSSDMLNHFCKLVREGGEVQSNGLRNRVKSAAFLAFAQEPDEIVGVAALKNPSLGYKDRVFKSAGSTVAEDYPYELGWVYVIKRARGKSISEGLVQALLKREYSIFEIGL